ncbi:MAG: histidine--tRNA ligase [Candidatus Omnitrophota bacterium]
MLKRVPGTKDILPIEVSHWQKIEEISRKIFSLYNYQEIRTPAIEDIAVYSRSLGESTEIIQKQMFLIRNNEDTYVLRPEGTASVVRAYIENNLDKAGGTVKFYYIGPMFRLERPQKGRLRQFHHIGAEVFGSTDPKIDIEIISLADRLLDEFDISGYEIVINSLGCAEDKKKLTSIIHGAFRNKLNDFCSDCKRRFETNVLRILDCKNEVCQNVIRKLSLQQDGHLCSDCREHFAQVKNGLNALKIEYRLNPYLVRGLDYYTRTVFEIKHKDLGAQDALGAGGRYDNLVKELGGPDVSAIGFAFGIERLLLVHSPQPTAHSQDLVYIIPLGEEAEKEGLKLVDSLRKAGISSDTDYENKSLKGAMRRANDLGARTVLIIGEDELKKNVVTLKDMGSGEQKEIKQENLIKELKNI